MVFHREIPQISRCHNRSMGVSPQSMGVSPHTTPTMSLSKQQQMRKESTAAIAEILFPLDPRDDLLKLKQIFGLQGLEAAYISLGSDPREMYLEATEALVGRALTTATPELYLFRDVHNVDKFNVTYAAALDGCHRSMRDFRQQFRMSAQSFSRLVDILGDRVKAGRRFGRHFKGILCCGIFMFIFLLEYTHTRTCPPPVIY